jgi:hypothetical protein
MSHIHPLASQVDAAQYQELLERQREARLAAEGRNALRKAERRPYPDSGDSDESAGDDSQQREQDSQPTPEDGGFEAKA